MMDGRSTARAAALVIVAWTAWLALRWDTQLVLEDALITFRHAENLATGQGYGFNPGHWVQGSTTPLFTLALALIGWLIGPASIPWAALALGLAAGTVTIVLSADLLEGWGCAPAVQVLAVLGWILCPAVVWSTVGGMETAWVSAFMALGTWGLDRQRGRWFGLAVAGLLLTRPDTLVFVGLLVVASVPRRTLWRDAWPLAIPVLAWIAWATWAFSTPVPHSLIAKSVVNPAGTVFGIGAVLARLEWLGPSLSAPFPGVPAAGWGLVALGGGRVIWQRSGLGGVAAVFIPLFAAALHLGRAPRFLWYPVPLAWAAVVVGAAAWQWVFDRLPRLGASPLRWMLPAVLAVCAIVPNRDSATFWREVQANEDQMRTAVGLWLSQNTPQDAVVAMEAIGYQGTLANRRIVDLAGLISPQVVRIAREHPRNAARFEAMLRQLAPDAVVLRHYEVSRDRHMHGGRMFASPAGRRAFDASYQEAARFSAPFPSRMGRNHTVVIYVSRLNSVN